MPARRPLRCKAQPRTTTLRRARQAMPPPAPDTLRSTAVPSAPAVLRRPRSKAPFWPHPAVATSISTSNCCWPAAATANAAASTWPITSFPTSCPWPRSSMRSIRGSRRPCTCCGTMAPTDPCLRPERHRLPPAAFVLRPLRSDLPQAAVPKTETRAPKPELRNLGAETRKSTRELRTRRPQP